ncbi:hypothetical protein CLV94_3052 [Flavobacterium endophyticum]|uniref:Uncharacterized protein n=1 Tax=Flavobacterium endophyticum TaxID=1540163 RepID=A0A495LZP9_9FLAO|nr:hypothetical protein CLV94_3052 [Flavobacterium endophyticum]
MFLGIGIVKFVFFWNEEIRKEVSYTIFMFDT